MRDGTASGRPEPATTESDKPAMKPVLLLDGPDWELIHLLPREWEWRQVWTEGWKTTDGMPAAPGWIRGSVPGDVIADSLDAGLIPNPYVDLNSRACEWLCQRDWVYRRQFIAPTEWRSRAVRLQFEGVDYACRIHLNGTLLGTHEGMFDRFEYEVGPLLVFDRPNWLVVVVEHAPPVDSVQGQVGHTRDARIWKSRFTYWWDWTTRLIPVGIWKSVRLAVHDSARITDVFVRTDLAADLRSAVVHAQCSVSGSASLPDQARLRLNLRAPDGHRVASAETVVAARSGDDAVVDLSATVESPQLWWPNDMGAHPLYFATVDLLDPDGNQRDLHEVRFGIRRLRLIHNETATADALPYTVEVNGHRMFIKGWNWVPVDNMYGRLQIDRYKRLLSLAKHAHCNLLRVWGGGLLEREEFYELCDRLGILVWQEFMQSSSGISNAPPTDDAYLAYVEQQARAMIPQKRNHPSLLLWCGGNELFDDTPRPQDEAHPVLGLLKSLVNELDPGRDWLPCSPSGPAVSPDPALCGKGTMHDVHGNWKYLGVEGQYELFNSVDPLFHSEFGVPGTANLGTLRKFLSPERLWPADSTNETWIHHASWWLEHQQLNQIFGQIDNIEDFVRAGQLIQAEGLRYGIEANRRRKWQCSGTIPWQLNEAFPNASCTNCVDYLGLTKPAYWWVRKAYEPVHISLRYDRLNWKPGETWTGQVWISNSGAALPKCVWHAEWISASGTRERSSNVDVSPAASFAVDSLAWPMPASPEIVLLRLTLTGPAGNVLSQNEYLFSTATPALAPLFNLPRAALQVRHQNKMLHIANVSDNPAFFVQILPAEDQHIMPDDDYFCLLAGEQREIRGTLPGKLKVVSWNSDVY